MEWFFRWWRKGICHATLGGLADADQIIAQQVNGHAEGPPPALPFLRAHAPVQALPAPVAVPIEETPDPLPEAAAAPAAGRAAGRGRKKKQTP
jgi:hypothetical protein